MTTPHSFLSPIRIKRNPTTKDSHKKKHNKKYIKATAQQKKRNREQKDPRNTREAKPE
jgi:hypothetical protein